MNSGLGDYGSIFMYAGCAGAHEFKQIGLRICTTPPPPVQARVERAFVFIIVTYVWINIQFIFFYVG